MAISALNPHAPIFVPSAYRTVEDFSDQWWSLVQSSPSFRDYWLRECFSDPQIDLPFSDFSTDFIFPDEEHDSINHNSVTKENNECLDLMALGLLKWRKQRGGAAVMPRYCREKAPKIVNVRVSPRPIQQPR